MFYSSRFRSLEFQLDCGNIFWSVVQGRRLNPSSAVGVCVCFFSTEVSVFSGDHTVTSAFWACLLHRTPTSLFLQLFTLRGTISCSVCGMVPTFEIWNIMFCYAFCFGVNKIYLFIHFLKRKKFILVSTTAILIWLKVTVKTLIISQNISVLNKCFSYEEYCIEMYHGFHKNIKQHSSFLILIIFKK